MATILGRRKTQEAPSAPTLEETISEQNATDTLRGKLDTLRPRIRDLETDLDAIEIELSDLLLADLMGEKPALGQLEELYKRRAANQRELEDGQAILQRAEDQLTAMADQENARLAAIAKARLHLIGEETQILEDEYATRIAEFGDFLDTFFANRQEYARAHMDFCRYSPNWGPEGVHQPRSDLFVIRDTYQRLGRLQSQCLREQVERWARKPEEDREFRRRENERQAAEMNRVREEERIAKERQERVNQQSSQSRI